MFIMQSISLASFSLVIAKNPSVSQCLFVISIEANYELGTSCDFSIAKVHYLAFRSPANLRRATLNE